MTDLPCVTIDAGVIAVPPTTCSSEDAHFYIKTLVDWSVLLNEPWIAIYMSERASEALYEDGLFPLRSHLQSLFSTHGIIEYDVNTVARLIERLLTLTPSFETYYAVRDILTEHLETDPDVIRLTTHAGLQRDLARCIVLLAILCKHCTQPLGGHTLVLKNAPSQSVKVKTLIHDFEHQRTDLPPLPSPPDFFEGDVLACDNFEGLVECINEAAILVGASDNLGIDLAIRLALFKHSINQGETPEWGTFPTPKIGVKFRETCQTCCNNIGAALPPKILRAIVETALGQNMAAVHALRTGPGGNAPQRLRGEDKAQRRDIDREFHLHYWECEDGSVELASIVYHNDFSIPS